MRRPVSRLIAAAAACLAIFSVWSLFPGEHSTAHAFNAFAEAIVEARTATFESNTKIEGMAEHKAQCYYLASGKMRTESKSSVLDQLQGIPEEARAALNVQEIQFVMIQDWKTGDSLMLSSTQKKATITHQLNRPSAQQADGLAFFEQMRDLLSNAKNATEAEFKPLGEKEIDGRRVLGFRRSSPELSTTLWGDPKTGLPVLVEMKSTNPEMESTMSHFKFNMDLKPELFDMTPPEDYTVNTVDADFSPPTEESLMTMFRLQTGLSDGVFFDNLDWDSQGELIRKQANLLGQGGLKGLETKLSKVAQPIGHGMQFAWDLPESADAHYAGKGVKRGEPDRPIFWYKPEGSDKYRVIYATLKIRNATAPPNVAGAVRVETPKFSIKKEMERANAKAQESMAKAKADGERIMADFKTKTAAIMKSVPDGDDMIAMKNLKTIAMAMQAAKDDKNHFPGDIWDKTEKDRKPLLSWRVALLPYLGKEKLYNEFRLDEPWDSKHNKRAAMRVPACYRTQLKCLPHGKPSSWRRQARERFMRASTA